MSQPYDRVYNFSAGPCTLPVPVLEEAKADLLNYKGHGMSVMEMSHRSKVYEDILAQTEADLRTLFNVPANYKILFLQGGASMQFTMIPMAYMQAGQTADYVTTGTWGAKAYESAAMLGDARQIYTGKPHKYRELPDLKTLPYTDGASYMMYTSNETVQGVQFKGDLDLPGTIVCDMSSDILSRPVDVTKYDMIYAGAQKNMGPAGVTVVIMSDEMLARVPEGMQPILDYRVHAENGSMYNTPPCWAIYMCGLVYKYNMSIGGLSVLEKMAEEKSKVIYDAIDASAGFFRGHARVDNRSTMNVTFQLPSDELTEAFIKEAETRKLDGLRGHRSVGGIRASIYNAFPKEGCEALADLMGEFAKRG